jgi:hypothetical protein
MEKSSLAQQHRRGQDETRRHVTAAGQRGLLFDHVHVAMNVATRWVGVCAACELVVERALCCSVTVEESATMKRECVQQWSHTCSQADRQ